MILHSAPQNEAIVSNVGEIGEFRIRNSAKAFSILSSGLYANKIRAIVRELSCNAVDSHVAAGKADTPFDVHLPTQLEPWFSIRDYGTGLTHEQVTNIYTTYFESTKTNSNEFIGALGLGSKSPFSYTDNFTVTANKDGKRGIYSAFINDAGVPSIALMSSEENSTEPNGVEVKFAVNGYNDFSSFKSEARTVYTHFKLRPVVSGASFTFTTPTYHDKDIVPGVHYAENAYSSVAIMGNIAYPIAIPPSDTTLGSLTKLLECGLVMEFGIGELDFQASREGLSYIPLTINSIKGKLEQLNSRLAGIVADEANKITNLWARHEFLQEKRNLKLWKTAAEKYAIDAAFPLIEKDAHGSLRSKTFKFTVDELAANYNIALNGFDKGRRTSGFTKLRTYTRYVTDPITKDEQVIPEWQIGVSDTMYIVENDTKVGALERAKYHFRTEPDLQFKSAVVYTIEAADKKKPVLVKQFLQDLYAPPANQIKLASKLLAKPRKESARGVNVTILKLQRKDAAGGYSYNRRDGHEMVWRDAGKAEDFDKTATHYYMPLSGFAMEQTKCKFHSARNMHETINDAGFFKGVTIYGVRKGDLEYIKSCKNWKNFEEALIDKVNSIADADLVKYVGYVLDDFPALRYNHMVAAKVADKSSPYLVISEKTHGIDKDKGKVHSLQSLFNLVKPELTKKLVAIGDELRKECMAAMKIYPMVKCLEGSPSRIDTYLADYINLVDNANREVEHDTQG